MEERVEYEKGKLNSRKMVAKKVGKGKECQWRGGMGKEGREKVLHLIKESFISN